MHRRLFILDSDQEIVRSIRWLSRISWTPGRTKTIRMEPLRSLDPNSVQVMNTSSRFQMIPEAGTPTRDEDTENPIESMTCIPIG